MPEAKTIASLPYVFTARPSPAACWAWLETADETFWMWISGFANRRDTATAAFSSAAGRLDVAALRLRKA